jgi:hypothetical protein
MMRIWIDFGCQGDAFSPWSIFSWIDSPAETMVDWQSLATARTTYSHEQLMHFNAAGIDPYLLNLAQRIGSQFNIAIPSQRNLANVFSNLPQDEFHGQRMGIGFSRGHVTRLLSESDGGFAFLSVVGCLGEYFALDIVVAVVMKLVRDFDSGSLPEPYQPDDSQWRRLIGLCQGALATSSFGVQVLKNHEYTRDPVDHVSVSQIVQDLIDMNKIAAGGSPKGSDAHAGTDAFWIAATAEYLFDLAVTVQDSSGKSVYLRPGLEAGHAQFVIGRAPPSFDEHSIDHWPLSKAYAQMDHRRGQLDATAFKLDNMPGPVDTAIPVSGGRAAWEHLFRSCFGRTYTDIESSLVAEFLGGAASLMVSSLQYTHARSQEFFLPHPSTIRGLSGFGLVETLTSWFPELRRLGPQMGRIARLPFQQARDRMDEISVILDSSCMCADCGNASTTSSDFCKHSVVECILALGLFIARTTVIPNLYPKRSGLIALYDRLHSGRQVYRKQEPMGAEAFMRSFRAALPTPRTMIETMCMLFAGSIPQGLTEHTLSITHEGITVYMNAWSPNSGVRDPENDHVLIRQRAGVTVSSGSSYLHGRIYEHGYWVPYVGGCSTDTGGQHSFSESFEQLRTSPREMRQLVKLSGGNLMLTLVKAGEEGKAAKLGWSVLC